MAGAGILGVPLSIGSEGYNPDNTGRPRSRSEFGIMSHQDFADRLRLAPIPRERQNTSAGGPVSHG